MRAGFCRARLSIDWCSILVRPLIAPTLDLSVKDGAGEDADELASDGDIDAEGDPLVGVKDGNSPVCLPCGPK